MSTIVSYVITEITNSKITHQHGVQQIDVLKYELITKFTKNLLDSNNHMKIDEFTIESITDILSKDLWSTVCYYGDWYKFNIKAIDIYNTIQEVKEKGVEILNVKYNNYADDYIDKTITNDSGLVKVNDVYSIRIYSDKQKGHPYNIYVNINQYIDVYENNIKIIHSLFEASGDSSYSDGFTYISSNNDINMFKYFKQLKKIEDKSLLNEAEEEDEDEEDEDEAEAEYEDEDEDEDEEEEEINWLPINNTTSDYYKFSTDDRPDRFDYEDSHYYDNNKNYYDHDEEEEYELNEDSNTKIGSILNKIKQKLYMYEWCDDVVLYFKTCLNKDVFISETLKPIKPENYSYRNKRSEKLETSEFDKFRSVFRPKLCKLSK